MTRDLSAKDSSFVFVYSHLIKLSVQCVIPFRHEKSMHGVNEESNIYINESYRGYLTETIFPRLKRAFSAIDMLTHSYSDYLHMQSEGL